MICLVRLILAKKVVPQIRFTVSKEAAGYLKWLSDNVLFSGSIDQAARHLMLSRMEQVRRESRIQEPSGHDIQPYGSDDEDG